MSREDHFSNLPIKESKVPCLSWEDSVCDTSQVLANSYDGEESMMCVSINGKFPEIVVLACEICKWGKALFPRHLRLVPVFMKP